MRLLRMLVVSSVVLCLPVAIGGQGFSDFGNTGAAFAKSDKSDKGGSGRSDKGDKGRSDKSQRDKGKSDRGKTASRTESKATKSGDKARSSAGKGPNAVWKDIKRSFGSKKKTATKKPVTKKQVTKRTSVAPKTVKVRPVNRKVAKTAVATVGTMALAHPSELKALNSLNRNINGLMNSSDPKMEPFRTYILASADREDAAEDLAEAIADLEKSEGAYQGLVDDGVLDPDPTLAKADLLERANALLDEMPAADDPAFEDWSREFAEVSNAMDVLEQFEADRLEADEAGKAFAEAEAAISEEALREAIAASVNETGQGPTTEADITPEVEAWVSDRLGVGDADGLIDDYIKSQETGERDADADANTGDDNIEVAEAE